MEQGLELRRCKGRPASFVTRLWRIGADIMEGLTIRDELQVSAHVPKMSAQIKFGE